MFLWYTLLWTLQKGYRWGFTLILSVQTLGSVFFRRYFNLTIHFTDAPKNRRRSVEIEETKLTCRKLRAGAKRRPTSVPSLPPNMLVLPQSWNRLGSPFSTILYSSLQLWERISLWQCREYQGKPNEALLCKTFGAVFIPDGIVWDFRPLWRAVSRNIDWKNGFTTAKEATLNQTNANKFYLYLLAIFFSKCSISAIYFCSLGREGLQFRQRKLYRTFI